MTIAPEPAPDTSRRQNKIALIALFSGCLVISCSPIFVRLSELDAISTAFWRVALALIPLAFLVSRSKPSENQKPKSLSDFVLLALPGIVLGIELVAWHISLHMTSVANSTLLVNMAPIFVTLFCWVVLRQTPRKLFLLALVVTIAGIVILKGGPQALGGGDLKGDAVAVFAAVVYAAFILLLGKVRERFATPIIMLWSTSAAAISILPFAWFMEPGFIPVTVAGWAVLFGLSWLSQATGQTLFTFALAWLPVTFSSLALLMQPVIASLMAWVILGEALTIWQCVGGSIVLVGILVARLAQR